MQRSWGKIEIYIAYSFSWKETKTWHNIFRHTELVQIVNSARIYSITINLGNIAYLLIGITSDGMGRTGTKSSYHSWVVQHWCCGKRNPWKISLSAIKVTEHFWIVHCSVNVLVSIHVRSSEKNCCWSLKFRHPVRKSTWQCLPLRLTITPYKVPILLSSIYLIGAEIFKTFVNLTGKNQRQA